MSAFSGPHNDITRAEWEFFHDPQAIAWLFLEQTPLMHAVRELERRREPGTADDEKQDR